MKRSTKHVALDVHQATTLASVREDSGRWRFLDEDSVKPWAMVEIKLNTGASEEALMDLVLAAGAEDLKSDDPELFEITTAPADFEKVKKALEQQNIPMASSEITMLPQSYVKLTGSAAHQMLALMNALEEHDDVKNVYANFDIPKEIIENAVK